MSLSKETEALGARMLPLTIFSVHVRMRIQDAIELAKIWVMAIYEDEQIHSFAYKRKEKNAACKILKLLSGKVDNCMGLLTLIKEPYLRHCT